MVVVKTVMSRQQLSMFRGHLLMCAIFIHNILVITVFCIVHFCHVLVSFLSFSFRSPKVLRGPSLTLNDLQKNRPVKQLLKRYSSSILH